MQSGNSGKNNLINYFKIFALHLELWKCITWIVFTEILCFLLEKSIQFNFHIINIKNLLEMKMKMNGSKEFYMKQVVTWMCFII